MSKKCQIEIVWIFFVRNLVICLKFTCVMDIANQLRFVWLWDDVNDHLLTKTNVSGYQMWAATFSKKVLFFYLFFLAKTSDYAIGSAVLFIVMVFVAFFCRYETSSNGQIRKLWRSDFYRVNKHLVTLIE